MDIVLHIESYYQFLDFLVAFFMSWNSSLNEQSRKLKVHGKDIHKIGTVQSLATCLHKHGKFGGYRSKENEVRAQSCNNLPRGYRYLERSHCQPMSIPAMRWLEYVGEIFLRDNLDPRTGSNNISIGSSIFINHN